MPYTTTLARDINNLLAPLMISHFERIIDLRHFQVAGFFSDTKIFDMVMGLCCLVELVEGLFDFV